MKISLSSKLLLIFLFAIVILGFSSWLALGFSSKRHINDSDNLYIVKYLQGIQTKIGYPPDISKAQEITKNKSVSIFIENPIVQWASSDEIIDTNYLELKNHKIQGKGVFSQIGFYKSRFVLKTFNQFYVTTIISKQKFKKAIYLEELLILLVFALLVILMVYYQIHRLFASIKKIEKEIKIIGKGNFSHRLDIKQKDEIGFLANSINNMTGNIEQIVLSKQQLLLAISHELRTPITRAKIATSMLEDEESKESIDEDLTEMEVIINELLETERLKKNNILDVDKYNINELIQETYKRYFSNENLVFDLDNSIRDVNVDATRMSLTIKNIIKNAVNASKAKQQNTGEPYKNIEVVTKIEDDNLLIIVKDYGIGIKKENIEKITEPFYREDYSRHRSTGGFGIGLYLIKLIVSAHKGKLIIKSKYKQGTTVCVSLPFDSID